MQLLHQEYSQMCIDTWDGCHKDVLSGQTRDMITVLGKPCTRFVTSVESSQNQRPIVKGDVDQKNGRDLLSPVGASCRDCQMGCIPR